MNTPLAVNTPLAMNTPPSLTSHRKKITTILLATLTLLSTFACSRPDRVIYASIQNEFTGREYTHTEDIINVFDMRREWQLDMYITVSAGDLGDKYLSGEAAMSPYRCDVTISDEYVSTEHDTTDILHYKHVMFGLVMKHELGHCFGLEHSEDPANIMYYTFDDRQLTLRAHYVYTMELQKARTTK